MNPYRAAIDAWAASNGIETPERMTFREAAKALGLTERTLRRWSTLPNNMPAIKPAQGRRNVIPQIIVEHFLIWAEQMDPMKKLYAPPPRLPGQPKISRKIFPAGWGMKGADLGLKHVNLVGTE